MSHIGIDIFSGAGGLSLGAEMAGIDVRFAIEIDQSAANTYRRNHKEAKVICDDICKLNPKSLKDKDEPIFIIMGGPPCQGFSMANTISRNMENPKNFLFKEFVRFVKEIQPKWFVLENVSGMKRMNHGETINMIEDCFRELGLGYAVKSKVLWAHEFGVPQKRNRLFMVGNRMGVDFEFPKGDTDSVVTVDEAFTDLPSLTNGQMLEESSYTKPAQETNDYVRFIRNGSDKARQNFVSRNNDLVIERYKHIDQGQNWRAIPEGNYSGTPAIGNNP